MGDRPHRELRNGTDLSTARSPASWLAVKYGFNAPSALDVTGSHVWVANTAGNRSPRSVPATARSCAGSTASPGPGLWPRRVTSSGAGQRQRSVRPRVGHRDQRRHRHRHPQGRRHWPSPGSSVRRRRHWRQALGVRISGAAPGGAMPKYGAPKLTPVTAPSCGPWRTRRSRAVRPGSRRPARVDDQQ